MNAENLTYRIPEALAQEMREAVKLTKSTSPLELAGDLIISELSRHWIEERSKGAPVSIIAERGPFQRMFDSVGIVPPRKPSSLRLTLDSEVAIRVRELAVSEKMPEDRLIGEILQQGLKGLRAYDLKPSQL